MLRATFFAAGLFVAMWGASLLAIDKVVLTTKTSPQRQTGFRGLFTSVNAQRQRVIDPPDWAAFSLMSVGSVTMLYAIALPKKRTANPADGRSGPLGVAPSVPHILRRSAYGSRSHARAVLRFKGSTPGASSAWLKVASGVILLLLDEPGGRRRWDA